VAIDKIEFLAEKNGRALVIWPLRMHWGVLVLSTNFYFPHRRKRG
jgi:hypothetical protein